MFYLWRNKFNFCAKLMRKIQILLLFALNENCKTRLCKFKVSLSHYANFKWFTHYYLITKAFTRFLLNSWKLCNSVKHYLKVYTSSIADNAIWLHVMTSSHVWDEATVNLAILSMYSRYVLYSSLECSRDLAWYHKLYKR